MFGNMEANYGTFGTAGGSVGLGFGSAKFGNFIAADGVRSGRFLDTPEYSPIHDIGNNQTIFDRLDYQPTGRDAYPSQLVRGAELDSESQLVRPVDRRINISVC